jgi:hypothetical protein
MIARIVAVAVLLAGARAEAQSRLDETPAGPGEWGYRPAEGSVLAVTPPGFSWRPQKGIVRWEIEVSANDEALFTASDIRFNVYCPPRAIAPGAYAWRYRGFDAKGLPTRWSRTRGFKIAPDARPLPLPRREDLLARIPKTHPRLFVRPEDLPRLKELARGKLRDRFQELQKSCEKILKKPPSTKEPPKYDSSMKRGSDAWSERWWGNRRRVIETLNASATLAFTHLLGGKKEYAELAKRILLEAAKWDPKGATGYRYNDEAGMPYAYYFSRAYTFLHPLLSEKERDACRRVMKIRAEEMYRHLCPRHFWRPYSSHSNRAWHFLGEVGIAFLGEIEGAQDWVWFAANVFFNCYPVWCDDDGGWHEGSLYWRSYQARFTWWADVMRAAMGINAYDKPYYSKIGYYAMYLMPPGKVGGGFGDLCAGVRSSSARELLSTCTAQANNGHGAWYVDRVGGMKLGGGYVGFVRGALPGVKPVPPRDLPTSRLFAGTGQAMLNTTLEDARKGVQVVFKSSPFGTQSHGYEANNSFLLWACGERLLIRSGRRDHYGSDHHKNWMWSTRSTNCVTLNGREGQGRRTASARGRIVAFKTTPAIDVVAGEAGGAYIDEDKKGPKRPLERFTRTIVFVKPGLVVVYDRLVATEPATFDYWLHAIDKMDAPDQHRIRVARGGAVCDIDLLAPAGLKLRQTNQYDPNPRPRVKLREWHLTASTPSKHKTLEFVAVYRPRRKDAAATARAELKKLDGGYALRTRLERGEAVMLLPSRDGARLSSHGLSGTDEIVVERRGDSPARTVRVKPVE